MRRRFEHVVEPGVRIVGEPHDHARIGACVRVVLDGVARQQPIAVVLRAADVEAMLSDALRLLTTLAAACKQQPLEVGDVLRLKNRAVFGAFKGVALARSAELPGALVAVPLHAAELDAADLGGAPRVLAALASLTRAWPVPEEVQPDRPPCMRPEALVRAAFANGMPRAGACSATWVDGRALVVLDARASSALLDQLRGGRPFVCGAPLDDATADAVLVAPSGTRAGERPAQVFARDAAVDATARVAANVCAVTVGGEASRGARLVEDVVAVVLAPHDGRRLCGALESGTPFFLDDPAPGAARVTVRPAAGGVTSARARVERVFLVALELMTAAQDLERVDLGELAAFHDALVVMADGAVAAHAPASGVELRVRWRAEPGRAQPRVSVQKTDATPEPLVHALGEGVLALRAPMVDAPLGFEVVLAVL